MRNNKIKLFLTYLKNIANLNIFVQIDSDSMTSAFGISSVACLLNGLNRCVELAP